MAGKRAVISRRGELARFTFDHVMLLPHLATSISGHDAPAMPREEYRHGPSQKPVLQGRYSLCGHGTIYKGVPAGALPETRLVTQFPTCIPKFSWLLRSIYPSAAAIIDSDTVLQDTKVCTEGSVKNHCLDPPRLILAPHMIAPQPVSELQKQHLSSQLSRIADNLSPLRELTSS